MLGYITWYFSRGVSDYLKIWSNYIEFFWYYFSIGFLLKTLFAPWKKDIDFSEWAGFDPVRWFNRFINNLIARIFGFIFRSLVVIFAIFLEILVIFFGLILFVIWIMLPLAFAGSLIMLFMSNSNIIVLSTSALGLLFSILAIGISIFSYLNYKRIDLEEESPAQIFKEKWFIRVWNRMGLENEDREIISSLSDQEKLRNVLKKIDLTPDDFQNILNWEINRQIEAERKRKFWRRENLFSKRPIGRTWSFGYTNELDKYSRDLQESLNYLDKNSHLTGHTKELEMAELVLKRPEQNNVLFVGDPGIGKMTLINFLAKKIRDREIDEFFNDKRLVELDLGSLISQVGSDEDIDFKLHKIFYQAAFAGNVILVINNLNEFLSTEGRMENIDITNILIKYLPVPSFQVIATVTKEAYHNKVEKNAAIMKNFDAILMEELSKEETAKAMLYHLEDKEGQQVVVTYQSIKEIVELCDHYITNAPFPEKGIDSLEEVIVSWSNNPTNRFITKDDVDSLFSKKFKIPIGKIGDEEKNKLVDLEKILHRRVIGQEEAINNISEALRRARAGIADSTKPIGSFLFMGSTGVGKTESAKALAEAYFGDENRIIRLDMSEFQTLESIDRLIGSQQSGKPGQLSVKASENPFSVLLIDEIEKAYSDILNLFLQVLDEGFLTDVFGKRIIFKNMIIIATSNAGASLIKENVEKGVPKDVAYKQIIDYVVKQGIFRPEFLNRFDKIIFFENLKDEQLREATKLILVGIAKRVYEKKGIKIVFEEDFVNKMIVKGYDPAFGMRSVKHFAQDKVEDVISKKIISGSVGPDNSIVFSESDLN